MIGRIWFDNDKRSTEDKIKAALAVLKERHPEETIASCAIPPGSILEATEDSQLKIEGIPIILDAYQLPNNFWFVIEESEAPPCEQLKPPTSDENQLQLF